MRLTVVTPVFNRVDTLEDCLLSVQGQVHSEVEHIVIDGGSSDGSVEILEKYGGSLGYWESRPDGGLYEAINKGIRRATGEFVGILGADDGYADERVLSDVAGLLSQRELDGCYGDLVYVSRVDPSLVIREWTSCPYVHGLFAQGWMPPHPTFFLRRECYERYGYYNCALRIAADYELMLRMLDRSGVRVGYLPRVLVRMKLGGTSNTVGNLLKKSCEDYAAWRMNGYRGGLTTVLRKNLSKLPQFVRPYVGRRRRAF